MAAASCHWAPTAVCWHAHKETMHSLAQSFRHAPSLTLPSSAFALPTAQRRRCHHQSLGLALHPRSSFATAVAPTYSHRITAPALHDSRAR